MHIYNNTSHFFYKNISLQLHLLLNIFLYANLVNYKPIFDAFGFVDVQPTFIGFIIITMYISNPPNVVS